MLFRQVTRVISGEVPLAVMMVEGNTFQGQRLLLIECLVVRRLLVSYRVVVCRDWPAVGRCRPVIGSGPLAEDESRSCVLRLEDLELPEKAWVRLDTNSFKFDKI